MLVIHHLLEGTQRFGDLTRALGGVSARTLTRQLREPEDSGVITRQVHRQIPTKVEYSLTSLGRELESVLDAMHAWGEKLDRVRANARSSRKSAVRSRQQVDEI